MAPGRGAGHPRQADEEGTNLIEFLAAPLVPVSIKQAIGKQFSRDLLNGNAGVAELCLYEIQKVFGTQTQATLMYDCCLSALKFFARLFRDMNHVCPKVQLR